MLNSIGSIYKRKIRPYSKLIQAICIPIFTLILPLSIGDKQSYCAYVMIIMSLFWLLETIPMAATSLLPILFFPLFGIMASREVTSFYIQDILMLFLAVIVLTQSIRSSGLNERLSIKIILMFGSNPKFLLLGIMCITWFLSIWISNNASVCMMMYPITLEIAKYLIQVNEAVTAEIKKSRQLVSFGIGKSVERIDFAEGQEPSNETLFEENSEVESSNEYSKENNKILKAFSLGVCFSSSIGGSGSLIASPPNILLKGFLDEHFPDNNINFLSFFLYSLPFTFTMLVSAWIVLCLLFIPKEFSRKSIHSEQIIEREPLKRAIRAKYTEFGSLNWEQKSIGAFFIILVLLWLTRDIYWIKGWSYIFPKGYVTDTTPAILVLIFVTIWPKENIFKGKEYKGLIDWKIINQSFPWNILLFAGGSFALSKGFEKSKLSNTIGSLLQNIMPGLKKELALGIIVILSEIGTEFTCNFSMSSILLPIVNSLGKNNSIDPLYLMMHTVMAINFSFMLPIATPTNSIVFANGHVKTKDMLISGGILKIVGILVIFLFSSTWYQFLHNNSLLSLNLNTNLNTTTTSIF